MKQGDGEQRTSSSADQRIAQPALVRALGGDIRDLHGPLTDGKPADCSLAASYPGVGVRAQLGVFDVPCDPQDEFFGRDVVFPDGPRVGAGELHGSRDDRVQYGVQIERGTHSAPDIPERRELLNRARQSGGACLELREQPGIVDGNHRLVSKGLQNVELSIGIPTGLPAGDRERTDRVTSLQHRDDKHATIAKIMPDRPIALRRFLFDVWHVDNRSLQDGPAGSEFPVQWAREEAPIPLVRLWIRAHDSSEAHLVSLHEEDGAGVRAEQPHGALADPLEYRLNVGRRGRDHTENLRCRRLLIERRREITVPCCSSENNRTFSIAMTAWSAKVWSSAISSS